jgi:hypothetical protein
MSKIRKLNGVRNPATTSESDLTLKITHCGARGVIMLHDYFFACDQRVLASFLLLVSFAGWTRFRTIRRCKRKCASNFLKTVFIYFPVKSQQVHE